ncbi:MAG: hypothetical protein ABIC19_04025 [Patescibacteria group bacterium]|nr:hypothetical protein [Patescibacteria group bacterium]
MAIISENKQKKDKETRLPARPNEEPIFSWRAPEYVFLEKSDGWYWVFFGILAALLAIAGLTKNFLMGVVFLLLGIVVYVYSKKKPREVEFKILGEGIEADGVFYGYETMKSFWIFYDNPPEDAFLSIQRVNKFTPYLQLPLGQADPVSIRKNMLRFLKEIKHERELAGVVEKLIRF